MIDIFTINHLLWIIAGFLIMVGTHYAFRNKSEKFQYWFLFSLTIVIWLVHFSRIIFAEDLKTYQLFFTNLCGLSTFLYPFLFLSKSKLAKDYMYYVGGFFALLSLAYPYTVEGDPIFVYNSIRFFWAHVLLVMIPLLMATWGLHKPNYKNMLWMFLFVMMGAVYCMALSAFFVETQLKDYLENYMGVWGNDDDVFSSVALIFAPWATYETTFNGVITERPIPFLYMIPVFTLLSFPIWSIMSIPFINFKKNKE
jgi:hypothetical protein